MYQIIDLETLTVSISELSHESFITKRILGYTKLVDGDGDRDSKGHAAAIDSYPEPILEISNVLTMFKNVGK